MVLYKTILLLAVTTCGFIPATAQPAPPGPEHRKIAALVGRWTIEGMENSYLEICDMYTGGYFLVCNSSSQTTSEIIQKGVSVIGYSSEGKYLTYYHFGSTGETQSLRGKTDDKGNFFFNGNVISRGKRTRTRVAMMKAGPNFHFKEETTTGNGPWQTVAEFNYIRLPR